MTIPVAASVLLSKTPVSAHETPPTEGVVAKARSEETHPATPRPAFAASHSPSIRIPPIPAILLSPDPEPVVKASVGALPLSEVIPTLPASGSDKVVLAEPFDAVIETRVSCESGEGASAGSSPAASAPHSSGPGNDSPAVAPENREAGPLPVDRSPGSVWIVARDPYTVCVHWDLDGSVLERQRQAFPGGEWRLCVWQESVGGHRLTEQPLPLDVTHRFVPVLAAGGRYVAEIGFRSAAGGWRGWAISQPTVSPLEVQYHSHVHLPDENPAPVPREAGRPVDPVSLLAMTPDREKSKIEAAGAAVVREALNRLLWREAREAGGGSSERVTEWVPVESQVTRDRVPNLSVGLTVAPSLPSSSASGSVGISSAASIPAPALPPSRGFWFRVNAEVILYGSTERDAKVTIAGRPIALRDDGSFSFRFLLPDGRFELPVIAVNAAGDDGRAAEVVFSRKTSLQGQVGVHPATPGLMPPGAAALG